MSEQAVKEMIDMNEQPKPVRGQIWHEVDPRQERHIRVESVGITHASVRAVILRGNPSRWEDAPKSRSAEAKLSRFNGKRGGYEFIEQPEEHAR